MRLLDLAALDAPTALTALRYLVAHPMRPSDSDQLNRSGRHPADALTATVAMSAHSWLILSDTSHPLGILGVRPFGLDGSEGLLWSICSPELEKATPELIAALAPVLAEVAAVMPALWAWKVPQDRPEYLPRFSAERGASDLRLVGPEPDPLSDEWLSDFTLNIRSFGKNVSINRLAQARA